MSLESLLASHPPVEVVDVDEETVVGGILGTGETTIHAELPVWITDLDPADVELAVAGSPTTTATATVEAGVALSVGWQLRLADGRVYTVTGFPRHARTPRGEHHRIYPLRRTT